MLTINLIGIVVGALTIGGGFYAYRAFVEEGSPFWVKLVGVSVMGLGFLTIYEYYVRETFYVNV